MYSTSINPITSNVEIATSQLAEFGELLGGPDCHTAAPNTINVPRGLSQFTECKLLLRRLLTAKSHQAKRYFWEVIKSQHGNTRINLAMVEIRQENYQIRLDADSKKFWA